MLSNQWLQLNYKYDKSIWISDIFHYYYWYDNERMFDFERFLQNNKIEFSKIAFY